MQSGAPGLAGGTSLPPPPHPPPARVEFRCPGAQLCREGCSAWVPEGWDERSSATPGPISQARGRRYRRYWGLTLAESPGWGPPCLREGHLPLPSPGSGHVCGTQGECWLLSKSQNGDHHRASSLGLQPGALCAPPRPSLRSPPPPTMPFTLESLFTVFVENPSIVFTARRAIISRLGLPKALPWR